jgi:hypothetical protein
MPIKDTDRVARANYRSKVKTIRVELYPTDEEIKNRLDEKASSGEPVATYIKRLIREDLEKK